MAKRTLGGSQPIKNITREPPERRWTTSDGEEMREKLNPLRAEMKRKMLDLTGGSYWLSLANGYAIKKNENLYGPQIFEEKLAKGHLPMNECPVVKGHVEPVEGDRGCGGVFTDDKPCRHIVTIAAKRKEAYAKRQADYAKHFRKNEEREVSALVEALRQVVAEKEKPEGNGLKTAVRGRGRKVAAEPEPETEDELESIDG